MRCSRCGKKIKKKSSFCAKCGAKVPPAPKKAKKAKKAKNNKKRSKAKLLIPALVVMLLAVLLFLLFGGDKVPERIRELKVYSSLTIMVKEKLPDKLPFELPEKLHFNLLEKLPFDLPEKLPFDFSFNLPFDLPDPGDLLDGGEIPNKKQIIEDLSAYEGKDKSKLEFDSLEIEKRITVEKEKKDTIYVTTTTISEEGADSNNYRLLYKRRLIGGWKLDEVKPYNTGGEKNISPSTDEDEETDVAIENKTAEKSDPEVIAGVDNKKVLSDKAIYSDITSDWKYGNTKVLEHYTNEKDGTDTVVVYMELENSYVNMIGTKEVTYRYNGETKDWEPVSVSKITCLAIEPVK